jgi:hypothetical protein
MQERNIAQSTLLHNARIFYEWTEGMVLVDFGMRLFSKCEKEVSHEIVSTFIYLLKRHVCLLPEEMP